MASPLRVQLRVPLRAPVRVPSTNSLHSLPPLPGPGAASLLLESECQGGIVGLVA
jgi:hypothetical protein